jgi:hypothetical protein
MASQHLGEKARSRTAADVACKIREAGDIVVLARRRERYWRLRNYSRLSAALAIDSSQAELCHIVGEYAVDYVKLGGGTT